MVRINSAHRTVEKPPYRVPTMAEIAEVRGTNGYNVVSTFSGAGGSCLGFEMAGFEILWASEFVPAAAEVYRLNHPGVPLDTRDIRKVQPEEIMERIGKKRGEIDVLEGSPPCASFSTAGKRTKYWGEVKKYSDTKQRTDDLFFEFARILEGLQPRMFVAENVAGLVKGAAKGYFLEILAALKDSGYNVVARVLDAQWLGVPQSRARLIFIGVRHDLPIRPQHPAPLSYRYSVREALPWILEQGASPAFGQFKMRSSESPSATLGAQPSTGNGTCPASLVRVIPDTRGQAQYSAGNITDGPSPAITASGAGQWAVERETDISCYKIGRHWAKLKPGETDDTFFSLIRPDPGKPLPAVTQTAGNPSAAGVTHPTECRKLSIAELRRLCSFPDDFQLTGSYSQQWERCSRAVPPLMMYHIAKAAARGLKEAD